MEGYRDDTDDARSEVSFAQLLAGSRVEAGLTQEELAERASLSVRAVSSLERGEVARPRRTTVDRLVAGLGLTGVSSARFVATARGQRHSGRPAGPAQLPVDLSDFTGRDGELRRLRTLVGDDDGPVRIVVFGGGGGVGKTALAVHLAHALRDRFPDGQLYADLAGSRDEPPATGTVLGGFLAALDAADAGSDEDLDRRIARYRSVLSDRRMLIVLDDAADAAQVRPLLPTGPGSVVLVTSRSRLADLAGAVHLGIGGLTDVEAAQLFGRVAGPGRVTGQAGDVARVVAACGRLPLAVRIAAARLAVRPGWTVAALADRLAGARDRLDELQVGDLAVRASFRLSYERLPAATARLFALLGHWPGHDFDVPVAAALAGSAAGDAGQDADARPGVGHRHGAAGQGGAAGQSGAAGRDGAARRCDVERQLEELTDRHLLESPAPGRYRQHDLLHAFARQLLTAETSPADSAAALRRLVAYLSATAHAADLALWASTAPPFDAPAPPDVPVPRFDTFDRAHRWYARRWSSLTALLNQLADERTAPARDVARLATLVDLYPFVRGDYIELEYAARRTVLLAQRAEDHRLTAIAHKRLGIALFEQHRSAEADRHYQSALAEYRAAGERGAEATILNSIGRRLMREADLSSVFRTGTAIEPRPALPPDTLPPPLDPTDASWASPDARRAPDDAGSASSGIDAPDSALDSTADGSNPDGIGAARASPVGTDRYVQARRYLLEGLRAGREAGRLAIQAVILCNLGHLEHYAGRDTEALRYLTEARQKCRRVGGDQLAAAVASNLGMVLARLGRGNEAIGEHERAVHLSRELGDRPGEATLLLEQAETELALGRASRAADSARRALRLRTGESTPVSVALARLTLGRALAALGQSDRARAQWRQALPVLSETDPHAAHAVRALLRGH